MIFEMEIKKAPNISVRGLKKGENY